MAELDGVAVHDDGECFADGVGVGCCVLLEVLSDCFDSFFSFDAGVEGDDVAVEEMGGGRYFVLDGVGGGLASRRWLLLRRSRGV